MSLILSIETSLKKCSVALHDAGKLLAYEEVGQERSHSEQITVLVNNILKNNISGKMPAAIAVSKGPGSYTGLRIGVATAKGLCYAMGLPLIAINTLQIIAAKVNQKFNPEKYFVCPMIDARRMEVYTALFDHENNFMEDTEAKILDGEFHKDHLAEKKLIFAGDGSEKLKPLMHGNSNALFVEHILPSAKLMGAFANDLYIKNQFEDIAYFEPYYLKEFYTKPL
ncbi:MAG TPA: tRNA (adenosine(37)-N6)-threonylcarbamoyltransferase complex dimerization subunit type 1 TsaB [Cytophagaceae bacterium]|jgi:tRNA threonylcarbamoyladenosine biosynthesis protein TsaB|nr:tRNA (adenosine(37)-N6)-threonylcarbamoyltransferase complex dimerization subunit type 1 TsaB [Cytophagaceae bacterium]